MKVTSEYKAIEGSTHTLIDGEVQFELDVEKFTVTLAAANKSGTVLGKCVIPAGKFFAEIHRVADAL